MSEFLSPPQQFEPSPKQERSAIETRLRRLCRIGVYLTLLFVAVANLFGRRILDQLAGYERLVPHIELAVVILVLYAVSRLLRDIIPSGFKIDLSNRLVLAGIAWLLAALLASELMIGLQIERVHFIKYGALTFLLYFSELLPSRLRSIPAVICCVGLLGAIDECMQALVPRRFFDLRDMLMNLNGAFFGGAIVLIVVASRPRLKNSRRPLFGGSE